MSKNLDDIESASELLSLAQELVCNGEYSSAAYMVDNAVRRAIAALESAAKRSNLGRKLQDRFAEFTNSVEILTSAQVIENMFSPILKPIGFDGGTEEPKVSHQQAERIVEYGRLLLAFAENKIAEMKK